LGIFIQLGGLPERKGQERAKEEESQKVGVGSRNRLGQMLIQSEISKLNPLGQLSYSFMIHP
jgi:hypothetical protein